MSLTLPFNLSRLERALVRRVYKVVKGEREQARMMLFLYTLIGIGLFRTDDEEYNGTTGENGE